MRYVNEEYNENQDVDKYNESKTGRKIYTGEVWA